MNSSRRIYSVDSVGFLTHLLSMTTSDRLIAAAKDPIAPAVSRPRRPSPARLIEPRPDLSNPFFPGGTAADVNATYEGQ